MHFFWRLNTLLFLLLTMSTQAMALTVYDVIQLSKKSYSDQDIIALIKATDSAFELKADDIPRLTKLGVSEPVIQVMLSAVPTETTNKPDHDTATPEPSTTITTPAEIAPRVAIQSESITEAGSGGHHHQVIKFSGIDLFILRDEGSYSSVTARANAIANRLRTASTMDGQFQSLHVKGKDTIIFTGTSQSIKIVSVSVKDARAYQRRSGRRVTSDLLASYWSDLLSDYWSIALSGQPPERLSKLHEGEALQELYKRLDTSNSDNMNKLSNAFKLLPKQEQDHLSQLATSIPRDFSAKDDHEEKTP